MINQNIAQSTLFSVENPYLFYEEIRSINPVYKGSFFKYPGWYVTGYQEAQMILKDHRFQTRMPLPETTKRYELFKNLQKDMMLFQNQPDHGRLRFQVNQSFTPNSIVAYHPYIEKIALELIEDIKHKKKIEFISDFAFPFASLVIAKILGVPEVDKNIFRNWALSLIQSIDLTRSRRALVQGSKTTLEMLAYFKELLHKKKQFPRDDLISSLIQQQENKELTEDELLATSILLVIAGHETTVNLLSNTLYCLLTNPVQYHKLMENPLLIESTIEECLRYESPTQMIARIASEDVKLNEVEIKKGDQVYVMVGAANRDPNQFRNPNVFDITRHPNPHLSFGAGVHFCLGSTLARLEAQIGIQTFLSNTVKMELVTNDIKWRNLIGFRAMEEMYVCLGN